MEKSILEGFIKLGYTKRRMAAELRLHYNTVHYWMLKYGLRTIPRKSCKKCGQVDSKAFDVDRHTVCRKCRGRREREKKVKAIGYKGGKCVGCGYCKCPGAMDFHHNDPSQKEYQWNKLRNMSMDRIYKELDKCTLYCKNCHAEYHWEEE